MWTKTKVWLKADKWRLAAIATWIVIVLFIICFRIWWHKPDGIKQNDELTRLQLNFEKLQKAYLLQKHITDSLIQKNSVVMYEVKHDTAVLPTIKAKYEKQKNAVRELAADEQLRFSAKWISQEDSLAK